MKTSESVVFPVRCNSTVVDLGGGGEGCHLSTLLLLSSPLEGLCVCVGGGGGGRATLVA